MSRQVDQIFVNVGDIELNVWHWPGEGQPILFLHATGFHARCWDMIIKQLPNPAYAVDLRFHGESGKKGSVEWPLMGADVSKLLSTLDLENVLIVGHSVGGYLATLAAAEQAERVAQLLLLDPVIMAPERYLMLKQMHGMMKPEQHPVARRRNAWQDADEMYERFKGREPFSYWHDTILRDYCDHALENSVNGEARKLACDPLHEVRVYLNQNGEAIGAAIPKVQAPTTVLRAREPRPDEDPFGLAVSHTWAELAEALKIGRDVYLKDLSHFIPMQAPDTVVNYIREALDTRWYEANA